MCNETFTKFLCKTISLCLATFIYLSLEMIMKLVETQFAFLLQGRRERGRGGGGGKGGAGKGLLYFRLFTHGIITHNTNHCIIVYLYRVIQQVRHLEREERKRRK